MEHSKSVIEPALMSGISNPSVRLSNYRIHQMIYGGNDVVRTKTKKKVNPRKAAKLYADRCCREYARKRYSSCVTCGAQKNLQWAHLLTAASESTRWDFYNFAVQCASCNLSHEFRPDKFTLWFLHTHGLKEYEALAARHWKPAHFKAADLIEIGDRYKALLETL
jgi:hypothetical protein